MLGAAAWELHTLIKAGAFIQVDHNPRGIVIIVYGGGYARVVRGLHIEDAKNLCLSLFDQDRARVTGCSILHKSG